MTSKKRLLAVLLAGALLLSSVAAAGVARSATANDPLAVAVENAGNDGATVTVTQNGSAVENASVIVEVTDDSSYAGAGTYATDENGTVSLPEPEENVTVEITVAKDDRSVTTIATLLATEDEPLDGSLSVGVEQTDDGATVTVSHNDSAVESAFVTVGVTDENATYEGAGNYTTDENGAVELPEPEENVTVEITAEKDDAAGSATVTLIAGEEDDEGDDRKPFGRMVSSFVSEMLDAGESGGPLGQAISDWVTSNNPGSENRPDHAGKSDVGAQNDSTDEDGQRGPPEHAGNGADGENDDDRGHGDGRGHGNDRGHGDDRGDSDEETTAATTES